MEGQSYQNPLQASLNKYLYNGKELQDDLGLMLYDFEARMFNSQLGRWHCPDPLGQFHSPYLYAANNPVLKIDPSGMWSFDYYLNGEFVKTVSGGDNSDEGDDGGDDEDPPEEYWHYNKGKNAVEMKKIGAAGKGWASLYGMRMPEMRKLIGDNNMASLSNQGHKMFALHPIHKKLLYN